MPSPVPSATYTELVAAPPMPSAALAGRFFGIGRADLRRRLERDDFPMDTIKIGQGHYVMKTTLLNALGISPSDLIVLAQMERDSVGAVAADQDAA